MLCMLSEKLLYEVPAKWTAELSAESASYRLAGGYMSTVACEEQIYATWYQCMVDHLLRCV